MKLRVRKRAVLDRRRPPAFLVSDTFSRADNAASLGRAETGQTWIASTANAIGVQSGRAYAPASGYSQRNVAAGAADLVVEADVVWRTGSSTGICLRGKAVGTDRIYLQLSTGLSVGKTVSGATSTLQNYALVPVDGRTYRLRLEARGTTIRGYLDGVLRITVNETDLQAETHAGIFFFDGVAPPTARIDNVVVLP